MPAQKFFEVQKEGYNTHKKIEEKYHFSHKNDSRVHNIIPPPSPSVVP